MWPAGLSQDLPPGLNIPLGRLQHNYSRCPAGFREFYPHLGVGASPIKIFYEVYLYRVIHFEVCVCALIAGRHPFLSKTV